MKNQETADTLQRLYSRLRILAITLKSDALEDGDVKEIGAMIEDLLVEELQPSIEAIKQAKE